MTTTLDRFPRSYLLATAAAFVVLATASCYNVAPSRQPVPDPGGEGEGESEDASASGRGTDSDEESADKGCAVDLAGIATVVGVECIAPGEPCLGGTFEGEKILGNPIDPRGDCPSGKYCCVGADQCDALATPASAYAYETSCVTDGCPFNTLIDFAAGCPVPAHCCVTTTTTDMFPDPPPER